MSPAAPWPARVTVNSVTIAQEMGRYRIVGEGVHGLRRGPFDSRMLGDAEVEDAPAGTARPPCPIDVTETVTRAT